MLTKGDEYPLHQTAEPIAFAGTDRNFYDRYFFNGYDPDLEAYFAVAFGVYPPLNLADAHLSIIRDGTQVNLHASQVIDMERLTMRVGPIRIEILEPLQRLRVVVEETDGIAADVTLEGRSFPIEEPRFTRRYGPRSVFDYTRLTQNVRWTGWLSVDGDRRDLPEGTVGTRDRSWGTRPTGARDQQPLLPEQPLSFFWLWSPVNCEHRSLFFHVNADPEGVVWNTRAAIAADEAQQGEHAEIDRVHAELKMTPGTRHPSSASVLIEPADQAPVKLAFEPVMQFYMRGIGYSHPHWSHGAYLGAPLVVEREDLVLADVDRADPFNVHVQALARVRVTQDGAEDETAIGVFESLIIGPYEPLGLTGMMDTA